MTIRCNRCTANATKAMNWDGQSPIKLCDACADNAKAGLVGKYFFIRPIQAARVLTTYDKEVLMKISDSDFQSAFKIGVPEKQLKGLVAQGSAIMTRGDGVMYFKKVKEAGS